MAYDNASNIVSDVLPIKSVENRRLDGTFGAGNIANPNGRPKKGQTLTDCMREYLESKNTTTGVVRKEEFVAKVAKMAFDGDATALRLIWNYLEGMPKQETKFTGTLTFDQLVKKLSEGENIDDIEDNTTPIEQS